METLFFLFIFSVIVGAFANTKNRNGFGWFLIAMFISPLLAFILLLVLPPIQSQSDKKI